MAPLYPAVDSNALTYLLDALGVADYDPAQDVSGLAAERVAMARCLVYGDCRFWVPPTARAEYRSIPSLAKRETHASWTMSMLQDQDLDTPEDVLARRVADLRRFHDQELDCRVLAETECAELSILLTCDKRLRRLQDHTNVRILRPSELWESLRASQPSQMWSPAPGNPLREKTWWRVPEWD